MRIGLVFSAVMTTLAAGGASAGGLTFDKTVPLSGEGRAAMDGEAGPIRFGEIVVEGIPGEAEIRKATHEYDHCKPRPMVVVSNTGEADADVRIELTLEDDQGNVYMKCSRKSEVDEHSQDETTNVCLAEVMKTADWPKVTRVHLVAKIELDD